MDANAFWVKIIYPIMAAIAGAVTALAFLKWKEMETREVVLTLFVGASFAIFVTPWLAHMILGDAAHSPQAIAGLTYVTASGSNTLLPLVIRWLGRVFGEGAPK